MLEVYEFMLTWCELTSSLGNSSLGSEFLMYGVALLESWESSWSWEVLVKSYGICPILGARKFGTNEINRYLCRI